MNKKKIILLLFIGVIAIASIFLFATPIERHEIKICGDITAPTIRFSLLFDGKAKYDEAVKESKQKKIIHKTGNPAIDSLQLGCGAGNSYSLYIL
jgi:hypothetical protein